MILRPQRKPLCGGKDPLKGGDQLIALFRDRYFEILAYLLTVLAEILRSSAIILWDSPRPFRAWISSHNAQSVRLEPLGLPPP